MAWRDLQELQVTVSREDLLVILRDNASAHAKAFLEDQASWLDAVALVGKMITEKSEEAKNKGASYKVPDKALRLLQTPPEDHSDEYTQIIGMLDMSVGETIEIQADQYRTFVMDDWAWKSTFLSNSAFYSSCSSSAGTGESLFEKT